MSNVRGARPARGVAVVGGPARRGRGTGAGETSDAADASETAGETVGEHDGLEQAHEEHTADEHAEDEHTGATATATTAARRARSRTVAPRRAGQPRWLVPALAATAVVSLLAAIVFGVKWSDLSAQNDTRATVQRVAKGFLVAFTNFTPKTVDADFTTISTYATGDFAKQVKQTFGSAIRKDLEQAQAWSQGQVRYLYVQSLNGNQASVYAEVDQTYANNKITKPLADVLQVAMAMDDTPTGWKISAVSILPPPSSSGTPTGNASSSTGK